MTCNPTEWSVLSPEKNSSTAENPLGPVYAFTIRINELVCNSPTLRSSRIVMFRDVKEARKGGERTLILSDEHGHETTFVTTFAGLMFASTDIQIRTRFACSNNAQKADGSIIGNFAAISDYVEQGGTDVEYYVRSIETSTSIFCNAVCQDALYAITAGRAAAKISAISIELLPDDRSRAELFLPAIKQDTESTLHVSVYCADEQFQTILGYLGFSSSPATIEVSISVPCFWPDYSKPNDVHKSTLALECGIASAQLETVQLQRHLPRLQSRNSHDQPNYSGVVVSNEISSYTKQIVRAMLHIELVVGFTAFILLASAILTWF
jgi:hypothetical protein